MKRHQFIPLDMTNRCAACPEILAHPVHAVTLSQQLTIANDAWVELGKALIAEGQRIVDWFRDELERRP